MLALAMPIMSGMLGHMLIGLADTIMVGHVGVVPLAAAAFVNAVTHLPLIFALGLLASVSVMSSQAFGARQKRESGEVFRHGLVLATVSGLASAMIVIALLPALPLFKQPAEVIAECKPYLVLFAVSIVPALIAHVGKQFCESLNRPWAPTFIMLGGVLLNVLLNWVFIYGHWGSPAMGLRGAGWATVLARSAIALGLLVYIVKSTSFKEHLPVGWFTGLHFARLSRMLQLGWPVGAQHLLEVSAFAFAAIMMGWISADAIAAHQIAITCAATSFMFALGTGMATCIRVGHAWGAGQHARMRRIGFIGVTLSAALMAGFALLFVVAGEPLARVFTSSAAVVSLTVQLLVVAAVFQLADAVQIAAISALRGLADVRVPAIIAALAYWVVAVPLGYALAFPGQMDAVGIWIGLALGLVIAAVSLLWRFHRKTLLAAGANGALVARQPSLETAAPVGP